MAHQVYPPTSNRRQSQSLVGARFVGIFYIEICWFIQIKFQAVKKVKTALVGKDGSRVKDLASMVGFTHTGPIGSFNENNIYFAGMIPVNFAKQASTQLIGLGLAIHCHTRLHFGFSAKLGIWQVPACKMEPRSGYIFWQNRPGGQPLNHMDVRSWNLLGFLFFQCCAISPPQ